MKLLSVVTSLAVVTALAWGALPATPAGPGSLLSRSEEVLTPAVSDNGLPAVDFFADETLHFDGVPYTGVGLTSGGTFYSAARFTPTSACTLKAILFYQWHNSSNDYAYVFGEGNDTTPGAVLESVPYSGADSMRWKRIDLNPPLVLPAGSDFWACVRLTHTAGRYPIGCDAGPMVRNRGGFLSNNRTSWRQLADQGLDYNWNIRAVISRIPGLAHDVGVSRILVPEPNVGPGNYQPVARVVNYGTNAESNFQVYCWIDSGAVRVYNQSVTVTSAVQPGSRTDVTFPVWHTGPGGASYTVTMFTDLSGDLNRANDTARQTTSIANVFALMDHDTGYCRLTVSCFGPVGYDAPADAGSGFRYPKTAASALYYGSFVMGTDTGYVADRYYGRPASQINSDLVAVESLRAIVPPGIGDEHFYASFSDAAHPRPKSLRVVQHSYMSADPSYDDFIVIVYDIQNQGSSAVNGLYAGLFMDFDIGSSPTTNQGTSDTVRRLVYMRQASGANPTVGVRILEPAGFRNLSLVDHAIYVYPDTAMTENMKWRFLNGTIVQRSSNRPYDWSIVASAGPFDINPGGTARLAVAVVGGSDENGLRANADAAQVWYNTNVGLAEAPAVVKPVKFRVSPNPFGRRTRVYYHAGAAGRIRLEAFDAAGRRVEQVEFDVAPGSGSYLWQPQGLNRGVYFLKVSTPDGMAETKVLRLN
ncbi:MAG: T9SS type A sorting domain-containing protein [candidate division WOR-3 bacterium]|uniref:T9SS type A sorting domain-containing protein n=1 Tax=candidate division WOR-3 bacterium TaxID=2052148 RepID=A0A7C3EHN8_UNCW3|nr:T9SS type A sorting domain-containing protein [candidate division WOR-3 bacterium]